MSDYEFIKRFKKVSIKNICIDLKLEKDYENILKGSAKKEKIKKVRIELEKRLRRIQNGL